jgi:hypothetical protein
MESCALCLDTVFSQRVPPVPSSQLNPLQTHSDTADLRLKKCCGSSSGLEKFESWKEFGFPESKKRCLRKSRENKPVNASGLF